MVSRHSIAKSDCRQALAFDLDVSGSVDPEEYQLQIKGLAAALTSPDVVSTTLTMPEFTMRLLVFECSGQNYQCILMPWTEILNIKTLQNLSTELRLTHRHNAPLPTALGKATPTSVSYLNQQPSCWKRTLDTSSDREDNTGPALNKLNLPYKISNIVINTLAIGVVAKTRISHKKLSINELATYFESRIPAGPGAFFEIAINFDNYTRAMSHKLLSELEFTSLSNLFK